MFSTVLLVWMLTALIGVISTAENAGGAARRLRVGRQLEVQPRGGQLTVGRVLRDRSRRVLVHVEGVLVLLLSVIGILVLVFHGLVQPISN